ncbi:MAG: HU family DNA-binding protein [Clostridia bacterium]|nr:HU family DNA-binding protein [Clostridia bacterium]
MNKTEMIAKVAKDAGLTKDQASKAVNAVLDSMTDALAAGEKVQIIGFGTFSVKACAEKVARIPKTGEKKVVPATKRPKFTAGQALKDAVANAK